MPTTSKGRIRIPLGKDNVLLFPSDVRLNINVTFILLHKANQKPTIKFNDAPFNEEITENADGDALSFDSTYEDVKDAIIMRRDLQSEFNWYGVLYEKMDHIYGGSVLQNQSLPLSMMTKLN